MNKNDYDIIIGISPDICKPLLFAKEINKPYIPVLYEEILGINYKPQKIYNQFTSGTGTLGKIPSLLIVYSNINMEEKVKKVLDFYEKEGHTVGEYYIE